MEFSKQEYWSGFPFPSPGDLPDPGIEPSLPHCRLILYCRTHQKVPYISLRFSIFEPQFPSLQNEEVGPGSFEQYYLS